MKKYEFTGETKQYNYRTLRQIRRISDGLVGGFIEKEENLSHKGTCFVFDNSFVYDKAQVSGNARVCDNAHVYCNALVSDNAQVSGNAQVYDNARVSGDARVYDNAQVSGNAQVYDNARVSGDARVYDNAQVSGNAQVYDNNRIREKMIVTKREDIVSFSIGEYDCTATKEYVRIGCQCRTYEDWKKLSREDAVRLGMKEYNYEEYKSFIQFCEIRFKRVEKFVK